MFQYLACLSTSSSNDKLAFDVGLQEHSQGEACWWTVHPASKQRYNCPINNRKIVQRI